MTLTAESKAALAGRFACPNPERMRWAKYGVDGIACNGCSGLCGMCQLSSGCIAVMLAADDIEKYATVYLKDDSKVTIQPNEFKIGTALSAAKAGEMIHVGIVNDHVPDETDHDDSDQAPGCWMPWDV